MIEQLDNAPRLACLEVRGGNQEAAYAAELPGLAGWIWCRPLRSARGGDLYYMSSCGQGVMARVAIADVSGHGETVSAAAAQLHAALEQHVEEWDQSSLIRQLNESFLPGPGKVRFATAFLASFYSVSGELLFTNAGHLPPLWYRSAARQWSFLSDATPLSKEIGDLPLGLIAGTSYRQTAVQVDPGDLLLLYTDGINETSDESGEQLGLDGLLAISQSLPTDSAAAAGKGLVEAVARFRGSAPAGDDETVIALERRAGEA